MRACLAQVGKGMGIKGMDQLATYEAMDSFAEQFEAQHMVYAPSNRTVSNATTALLLSKFPRVTHGLGRIAIRWGGLEGYLCQAVAGCGGRLPCGASQRWPRAVHVLGMCCRAHSASAALQ